MNAAKTEEKTKVTLPSTEGEQKAKRNELHNKLGKALEKVSKATNVSEVDAAVQEAKNAADDAVELAVLALQKSKLPQHTPEDEDAAAEFDDFATQAQTTAESVRKAGEKKTQAQKW